MYRVVVCFVKSNKIRRVEFPRRSVPEAKRLVESLNRVGFWLRGVRPLTLVPPTRIKVIELYQLARPARKRGKRH